MSWKAAFTPGAFIGVKEAGVGQVDFVKQAINTLIDSNADFDLSLPKHWVFCNILLPRSPIK